MAQYFAQSTSLWIYIFKVQTKVGPNILCSDKYFWTSDLCVNIVNFLHTSLNTLFIIE